MKEHGLYKFVDTRNDEIIYIGKSNNSLRQRVESHIRGTGTDAKFIPYTEKCKVYVALLPNNVETDILERALINQYKPVLNVVDNYEGVGNHIIVKDPDWMDYEDYIRQTSDPTLRGGKVATKKNDAAIRTECRGIYLGSLYGEKFYLENRYEVKIKGRKVCTEMYSSPDEAVQIMKEIVLACKYGKQKERNYVIDRKIIACCELLEKHLNKIDEIRKWDFIINTKNNFEDYIRITSCIETYSGVPIEARFYIGAIEILEKLFRQQLLPK